MGSLFRWEGGGGPRLAAEATVDRLRGPPDRASCLSGSRLHGPLRFVAFSVSHSHLALAASAQQQHRISLSLHTEEAKRRRTRIVARWKSISRLGLLLRHDTPVNDDAVSHCYEPDSPGPYSTLFGIPSVLPTLHHQGGLPLFPRLRSASKPTSYPLGEASSALP